jgi:hypothetical protein
MIEMIVDGRTMSYSNIKPRVTYGRFAGDFERRSATEHVAGCTLRPVKGSALRMPWLFPRSQRHVSQMRYVWSDEWM